MATIAELLEVKQDDVEWDAWFTDKMSITHLALLEDHLLDYSQRSADDQCKNCMLWHCEKLKGYSIYEAPKFFDGDHESTYQKAGELAQAVQDRLVNLAQSEALDYAKKVRDLRYELIGYGIYDFAIAQEQDRHIEELEGHIREVGGSGDAPAFSDKRRAGRCYELAWRHIAREQEGTLIHGEVYSHKQGRMIPHAWVETETGFIYEPESDRYFEKDWLYRTYKMKEEHRYTVEEAAIMAARTNNLGPWTAAERQLFLAQEQDRHIEELEANNKEAEMADKSKVKEGIMAEYKVREVRLDDKCHIEVVIHGDEIVGSSAPVEVGLYGHPLYYELYAHTLKRVKDWKATLGRAEMEAMKLLTKEIRDKLPPLYSQEKVQDPMGQVKFFTPDSNWTWYGIEFDGKDLFFGWVVGLEKEMGYFSLKELESARGPLGLAIERDKWFTPLRLSEVKKLHQGAGVRTNPGELVKFIKVKEAEMEQRQTKFYQIPVVLTVEAKDAGGVVSLVRQLERRAGWGKKLPIEFTTIGIGQIKSIEQQESPKTIQQLLQGQTLLEQHQKDRPQDIIFFKDTIMKHYYPKEDFHPDSFRVVKPEPGVMVTLGCLKKDKWYPERLECVPTQTLHRTIVPRIEKYIKEAEEWEAVGVPAQHRETEVGIVPKELVEVISGS